MRPSVAILATGAALAFSVYPILYLLAENREQMYVTDAARPLAIAAAVGLVVFCVAWAILADARKATLFLPAVVALVFVQKPVITALRVEDLSIAGINLTSILSLLLLTYLAIRLRRTKHELTPWFHTAALIALALIVLPIITLVRYEVTNAAASNGAGDGQTGALGARYDVSRRRPDIYYIILDGYGRHDVLESIYGFDNGSLLTDLEQRDFVVARASRSNYTITNTSLASSLNCAYLDEIEPQIAERSNEALFRLIKDNAVARLLRSRGYAYISIGSGWPVTSPNPFADHDVVAAGPLRNLFESTVLDLLPVATEKGAAGGFAPNDHRERVLFQFDALGSVASSRSPKFVFCHIISPHPPFVFDEHGRMPDQGRGWGRDVWDDPETPLVYKRGYVAQLRFINEKLLATVDAILAQYPPDNRPIIILQADHGPEHSQHQPTFEGTDFFERMSILNAYYVSSDTAIEFDDEVTPVNTFRILLNGLFNAGFEILPNRYFSTEWASPFLATPIPEERLVGPRAPVPVGAKERGL